MTVGILSVRFKWIDQVEFLVPFLLVKNNLTILKTILAVVKLYKTFCLSTYPFDKNHLFSPTRSTERGVC